MNWIESKNLQPIPLNEIPVLPSDGFLSAVLAGAQAGWRVVQFYGCPVNQAVMVYAVMADDDASKLYVSSCSFQPGDSYPSLTPQLPAVHLFERELYEQWGITPVGHPWLKPVRKGIAGVSADEKPYEFFSMDGPGVHEVAVGPIHAGTIEPGHFRFLCTGEEVHHLEIQTGFQHRGVEQLMVKKQAEPGFLLHLAESIAGDSVIAHGGTFVRGWEALAEISVSARAGKIRTLALELERIGIHLGDISALAGDVAYLTGSSVFAALRTRVINTSLAICGSRYGRGLLTFGGVHFDLRGEQLSSIQANLQQIHAEIQLAVEVMFHASSLLARFEKTGIVTQDAAQQIGMVGPAARASGIAVDVRCDHPAESYCDMAVHKMVLHTGDVFARSYLRVMEIQQSFKIVFRLLNDLKAQPSPSLCSAAGTLRANHLVVSMTEGWRGEVTHSIITDNEGKIRHYKIKDPSFHNWMGLALAVRKNGISDFPICNKSFNLSYCGTDL